MPSPVRFAIVRRQLEAVGWTFSHISGSHHVFKKPGQRSYPVPVHGGKVQPNYVRVIDKLIKDAAADHDENASGGRGA